MAPAAAMHLLRRGNAAFGLGAWAARTGHSAGSGCECASKTAISGEIPIAARATAGTRARAGGPALGLLPGLQVQLGLQSQGLGTCTCVHADEGVVAPGTWTWTELGVVTCKCRSRCLHVGHHRGATRWKSCSVVLACNQPAVSSCQACKAIMDASHLVQQRLPQALPGMLQVCPWAR